MRHYYPEWMDASQRLGLRQVYEIRDMITRRHRALAHMSLGAGREVNGSHELYHKLLVLDMIIAHLTDDEVQQHMQQLFERRAQRRRVALQQTQPLSEEEMQQFRESAQRMNPIEELMSPDHPDYNHDYPDEEE